MIKIIKKLNPRVVLIIYFLSNLWLDVCLLPRNKFSTTVEHLNSFWKAGVLSCDVLLSAKKGFMLPPGTMHVESKEVGEEQEDIKQLLLPTSIIKQNINEVSLETFFTPTIKVWYTRCCVLNHSTPPMWPLAMKKRLSSKMQIKVPDKIPFRKLGTKSFHPYVSNWKPVTLSLFYHVHMYWNVLHNSIRMFTV